MINTTQNVYHVLSVPLRAADSIEVRGTVRSGTFSPQDTVWFVTPGGNRHELGVRSVKANERYVLMNLQGDKDSLDSLDGGYYLFRG